MYLWYFKLVVSMRLQLLQLMGMSHHTESVFVCFCKTLYELSYKRYAKVFAKHQHVERNTCGYEPSYTVCVHVFLRNVVCITVMLTCLCVCETLGEGTERAIVLCRLAKPKCKVLPGPVVSLPPDSEASLVLWCENNALFQSMRYCPK